MPQDYKQGLWTGRGKGHAGDVEGGVGCGRGAVCGGVGVDIF